MAGDKKIFVWIASAGAAVFALLIFLFLLVPGFLDMTPYKEKALAEISRATGGKADFQEAGLSFLPRPCLMIRNGKISVPGGMDATVESLAIYPDIMPLFKGDIRVYRLKIESPDIIIDLARFSGKKEKGETIAAGPSGKKLRSGLTYISSKVPGLVLAVSNGRLNVTNSDVSGFWFKNINALIKFPPDRLVTDLKCESGFWEQISLKGSLNPENLDSFGHLEILQLQPREIAGHFFPSTRPYLGDSALDLALDFKTDGTGIVEADVQGAIPLLTLSAKNKKLEVKGKHFKGAMYFSDRKWHVAVDELNLDAPRINLSGAFRVDRTKPLASLELVGREIDAAAVRSAINLFADNIPEVRTVFDIVRGGRVPEVRFRSRGRSLGDLGRLDNMVVTGSLDNGDIFVPGVGLDLKNVSGEVTIADGVLEGKNLRAMLGNSSGHNGAVKLGLEGESPPFHLDVTLDADLAQLPAVLKQFAGSTAVMEAAAFFEEVRGGARGRLILGERIGSIKTTVDVSEFNLSARCRQLMYPLKIRGGPLSYDGERQTAINNLEGSLGASSFSGVYAGFDLRGTPRLDLKAGVSTLDLKEIYALLSSFGTLKGALHDFGAAAGSLNVTSLELKGPLSDPAQWQFKTEATVQDLVATVPRISGPVTVSRGEFAATPEKISVKGVESTLLDASFVASGTLDGYTKGFQKADVTLQGTLGPAALEKVSARINLPPELGVRPPLHVSQSRLTWRKEGPVAFNGNLAASGGPELSLDASMSDGKLMVRGLHIRDKTSDATMAMTVDDRTVGLDFNGHLNRSTLDRLLQQNRFLTGGITGDFRVRFLKDRPLRSWIWGKLNAKGIAYSRESDPPVRFENVSLSSVKNRLFVESALFTLGDNRLSLGGTVEMDEKGHRFDMDLSADGIAWDNVAKLSDPDTADPEKKAGPNSWVRSLRGKIRIRSDYLTYGRFTWSPIRAALTFDGEGMDADITEAMICGVSTPGTLRLTPEQIQLEFKPVARYQEVESVLPCLWTRESDVSGRFDFDGVVTAKGEPATLKQILRGNFQFKSYGGRIYKDIMMERIFSLLNVANIIRGDFSAFSAEGFAYDSVILDGAVEAGKLAVNELVMEAPSMNIAGQGELDLMAQTVNLRLLVNPLQNINLLIGKIPGIGHLAGDNLISFPMKVTGDMANPKVSTSSVSEIGSELPETMKRLIEE